MFYKTRQRLKRFNHYKKTEVETVEQAPLVEEKKTKGKPKTSKKVEGENK